MFFYLSIKNLLHLKNGYILNSLIAALLEMEPITNPLTHEVCASQMS